MFIIYTNNAEVIVTTKKREKKTLEAFFNPINKRDKDDYARLEMKDDYVLLQSILNIKY